MLRCVVLVSLCAASTLAFSPAPLSLSPPFSKRGSPAFAQRSPRSVRWGGGLRMQTEPKETEVYAEQGSAEGVEQPQASREPVSWFDKTTAQDREFRQGGDPQVASPKRERSNGKGAFKGVTAGLEKESYGWYKNQELKKSVFGRTLNPLTGKLEEKGEGVSNMNLLEDPIFYVLLTFSSGKLEEKGEGASTMNLLEDPIFYALLIIAVPTAIMFAAAYACLVPALSLAFGFQCAF
ncbi:hypothetical protein T484DRAFT_1896099 [Baffinella frigidus]|nr:hypothetical protein T484DRAFT_1896099 [Cryptophyta sp. CCMP2293]